MKQDLSVDESNRYFRRMMLKIYETSVILDLFQGKAFWKQPRE